MVLENEMKVLAIAVALAFMVVGLFMGLGVIPPVNESEGLLTNLLRGGPLWQENPALIGVIVGVIVNFFGYMENLARNRMLQYDFGKLAETWAFYEPMLILTSQALSMEKSVIVAVVIDVMRRAITAYKTQKT